MKIQELISCFVVAQLMNAFVFAKERSRFSHDAGQEEKNGLEI